MSVIRWWAVLFVLTGALQTGRFLAACRSLPAATAARERPPAGERSGEVRASAPASGVPEEPLSTIDQFCDGLQWTTKMKARRRLFGLFQKDAHAKGRWIEFSLGGELDAEVKSDRVSDVAQVWSRGDGAMATSTRISSRHGDWIHYVEHCFRADGVLARAHATLNTVQAWDDDSGKVVAGATRERDHYFDDAGREIAVLTRVLDFQTKQPAPTLRLMDYEERIYKVVGSLPFYSLLKGHDTGRSRRGTTSSAAR